MGGRGRGFYGRMSATRTPYPQVVIDQGVSPKLEFLLGSFKQAYICIIKVKVRIQEEPICSPEKFCQKVTPFLSKG